ncbi:MAG: hypothetical protein ACTSYI_01040 [Promethearchaeota archaeon]
MDPKTIGIFQFHGCDSCFWESISLSLNPTFENAKFIKIQDPTQWSPEHLDYAIITGYLTPLDSKLVEIIAENSVNTIAFGSCAVSAGIFGLGYQKGHEFLPLEKNFPEFQQIPGCVGDSELISNIISNAENIDTPRKNLCDSCQRKSSCDYLDEVNRQIDLSEDLEACFNDLGFLCSGYIAKSCKERCIDFGTPCRGCDTAIDRPGFRMLGMFATLMANVEVASESTEGGSTDKLSDKDDDVSNSFPDVTGSFFRFNFANSVMPPGKIPSQGNLMADIMVGRPIEEVPLITGCIGGHSSISLTLDTIEAYELGNQREISSTTQNLRKQLRQLEEKFVEGSQNENFTDYLEITSKIRVIAGNLNLSNVFFGGFKTEISGYPNFEEYSSQIFDVVAGEYSNNGLKFTLNEEGKITNWNSEKYDFQATFPSKLIEIGDKK